METSNRNSRRPLRALGAALLAAAAACAGSAAGDEVKVTLSGSQEIPPVTTAASGTGTFAVAADGSVGGSVTVTGMTVTVAHVHEGAAGTNGPIVIPLTKTADAVWSIPAGIRLTDAQFASYKAGNLYYNVHSAAWKSGEIRAQIRP